MLNMQRGLEYSLWKMDGVRSWMLVGNGLCPFDYGSLFSLTQEKEAVEIGQTQYGGGGGCLAVGAHITSDGRWQL